MVRDERGDWQWAVSLGNPETQRSRLYRERWRTRALHHHPPRWRLPSPHLANDVEQLTFRRIIGPRGSKRKQRTIWAELRLFSLTDDVTVLAEPDGQALWDEHDGYQAFTEQAMKIGRSP